MWRQFCKLFLQIGATVVSGALFSDLLKLFVILFKFCWQKVFRCWVLFFDAWV